MYFSQFGSIIKDKSGGVCAVSLNKNMKKAQKMQTFIDFFSEHSIQSYGVLPFSACTVTRPYLYEKNGLPSPKSVIPFLIPYYTGMGENLSAYAVSRDYHAYAKALFADLARFTADAYPDATFLGFADHSPIDERDAAARAGLGVIGKNGLLIHKDYSSFVFIAEILSSLPPEALGIESKIHEIAYCCGCGACRAACPTGVLCGKSDKCLSAITQKKGALDAEEIRLIRENGTAWGCDACQTVCPYTTAAIARGSILTPIEFFRKERVTRLSRDGLCAMSDEEFAVRAFSWRGKDVICRNLAILEEKE